MTRVALFGVALAAAFVLAFAGGRVLDVGPRTVAEAAPHGEGAMGGDWAAFPAGLAVAMDGYRLVAERTEVPAGRTGFVFRIEDDAGRTVRDFDVEHEKRLHLIVVSRDLETFLHLHPEQRADGSWATTLRLPSGGVYRVFADFTPTGGDRTTLGVDVFAAGPARPAAAPRSVYETELERDGERLVFRITRDGEPLRVEPYLGAGGHLVVLRAGDLAYVHAHAEEDELAFEVPFPTPGGYRLFLQFKVDGSVQTATFEVEA